MHVIGNWKMHGLRADLAMARRVGEGLPAHAGLSVMICPPFPLLFALSEALAGSAVAAGAQDCHPEASGAFTGDVSAEMIQDSGATAVILGHSERRHGLGEDDLLICRKVAAAVRAGLIPILCVGETEGERDAGQAFDTVARQLTGSLAEPVPAGLLIAYEPVWAIGTGRTPTDADIAEMHQHIQDVLIARFGAAFGAVPILYGGSVKPDNAGRIMALQGVGGVLVGGASLSAESFLAICHAAAAGA